MIGSKKWVYKKRCQNSNHLSIYTKHTNSSINAKVPDIIRYFHGCPIGPGERTGM